MPSRPFSESFEALSSVFKSLGDGITVLDARGQPVFVNEASARMLGFPSAEVAMRGGLSEALRGFEAFDEQGRVLPAEQLPSRLALQGQQPPPTELSFRSRLTGEETRVVLTATPLFGAEGQVEHVVNVFRDVTGERRSARSLQFLADASAALAASFDYVTTLRVLVRVGIPELADMCSVEVFEEDGSLLHERAHVDPRKEEVARELARRYPVATRSASRKKAIETGQPQLVASVTEDFVKAMAVDAEHLRLVRTLGLRTILSVPLNARGRVLGTLILAMTEGDRRFDEARCSLAMELASRAALAVDNARLYREAQAAFLRKDQEARINDVLQRLGTSFASELEPGRLLQLIVDETASLVGAPFGVFIREPAAQGGGAPTPTFSQRTPEALARRIRHEWLLSLLPAAGGQATVRFGDVGGEDCPAGLPPSAELAGKLAARSLLGVSVVSRTGDRLGGLFFGHPEPGAFTAEHERAVASLAAQAAVALDNARLFHELHVAQERLRASEERLRLALDAGRMGYYDFDPIRHAGTASPRLREIYGVGSGEFGFGVKFLAQVVHPEDLVWVTERFTNLIREGGRSRPYEFRVVWPDGSVHWVEHFSTLLKNDQGEPLRLIGIMLEVTERHQAQERLEGLLKDLIRSNAELEQFAYIASHDLQQPLRMVASYTQLLARRYEGQLDADADEFIRYAVNGVNRMQQLIHDLLAYSRVGSGAKPFAPVACQQVLERTLSDLEAAIEESGARITADPLPTVSGDEVQLGQLLQNLLGNAIKFRGASPPHVHVGVERREDHWLFSVRDDGIGIDPQYIPRLFVLFRRLHTPEQYAGSGLGLAICKKIVERHGGRIWVESRPGRGATFFFTLPLEGGAVQAADVGSAPRKASTSA